MIDSTFDMQKKESITVPTLIGTVMELPQRFVNENTLFRMIFFNGSQVLNRPIKNRGKLFIGTAEKSVHTKKAPATELKSERLLHFWKYQNIVSGIPILREKHPLVYFYNQPYIHQGSMLFMEIIVAYLDPWNYFSSTAIREAEKGAYNLKTRSFSDMETEVNNSEVPLPKGRKLIGNEVVDSAPYLFSEGLDELLDNLSLAEESKSPMQLMLANKQLALFYLALEDYPQAKIYVEDALGFAKNKLYLISDEYNLLKLKLELNKQLGNDREEYSILKRLNDLRDSIDQTNKEQYTVNSIALKYQKGLYDERFRLNQTFLEKERFLNKLFRGGFFLVILILIILSLIYRMKINNKTIFFNRKIMQLESEQLNLEKSTSAANLNYYSNASHDKSLHTTELSYPEIQRIANLGAIPHSHNNKLQKLLQSHLMTNENWFGFKEVFIEEFPLFYKNLKTNYPNLTEHNLRIIFLTKLELSNHEIARVLGISYEAVKKAKQRLRKKVEEPSVEDFIKVLT